MTDIFVSYAREDRDRIEQLVRLLEERGWSVWWDRTIASGSDFADTIETAIEEARCVVVAWSKHSVASHWVRDEASIGRSRAVLVPVRLDDVQPPIGFRHLQTADLVGWSGRRTAASDKLLADLDALLTRLRAAPAEDAADDAPVDPPVPPRPARSRWPRIAALAALGAAAIVAAFWLSRPPPEPAPEPLPPQSAVAVLPFGNLTGNEQLSYIGTGLAAGLISELSALPGINLVGKSRAWPEWERVGSLAGLAESLGVSLVVEGDVRPHAGGLRVDVAAVDGPSAVVLWSGGFEGSADDLYGLQSEIVVAITRLLSASLDQDHRRRIARGGPPAQAFDFYLQGLERLDQSDNPRHAEFAEDLFRQAIVLDPEAAIFHAALSDALWVQYLEDRPNVDLAAAEREARRALELDPDLPQGHVALARAMRAQGKFAESIAELRQVLAGHPKPDEAFRELAHGYSRAGDNDLAGECYETATVLGPDNWFNWNAWGVHQASQGDLEGALASLERAAELAPPQVQWPRLNRIGVRILLGDSAAAIADYEALGAETSNQDLASNVGTAYYFEGRLEEAVEMYRRAVELAPDDHVNRRNLGDALEALERPQEAALEFRAALGLAEKDLEESPNDNELLSVRALYAAKAGDCESAVPHAERTRSLLADNWQDHLHLAMAFALCERPEPALEELRVVVGMGFPAEALREQAELASLRADAAFAELVGGG